MRVSSVIVLCVVLALALTISARSNKLANILSARLPLYKITSAPTGWTVGEVAPADAPITFTLIVEGSNAAELEQRFWQVSDPDHELYGQHMTNSEIEAMVAPSFADLNILYSTLAQHGIEKSSVTSHGDSFDISTTVEAASSLFNADFAVYTHTKSGLTAIRQVGQSTVPVVLAQQLRLVLGVHTFPTVEQRMRMSAARQANKAAIKAAIDATPDAPTVCWVPKAVASIYQVPYPIAPLSTPMVQAGVIEWSEQTFSAKDLALFSTKVGVPLAPVDAHHIYGNNSQFPPGIEAELDIQWIEGINPAFTPWFWLVTNPNQWMFSWTIQFLTATEYPSIVSLSYGLPELDQCQFFNPSDCNGVDYRAYIHIVDKQFMKIGLIGTSIITATQDRGVYAPNPTAAARFTPEYPGSSAFVTSVGATEYTNPVFNLQDAPPACNSTEWQCISGGSDEESVSYGISGFLSSGGFSDVDVTPAYQAAEVQAYFNSGVKLPDQTLWNRTGRGSPDVSAIGMNGYVIQGGYPELVSGASMSTPIVAGIIALVQNDYYQMTNMTLGFLNPLLYKAQAAGAMLFKDIVLGSNCATLNCTANDGFITAKGWDPVSGLGSPLYANMKKYVQQLAQKVVARKAGKVNAAF